MSSAFSFNSTPSITVRNGCVSLPRRQILTPFKLVRPWLSSNGLQARRWR
jgi:hypothetical protein